MEGNNLELVQFCISKIGTPYVMGTSGRILTQAMYKDLVRRNPAGWFINKRLDTVRSWIGTVTVDCHGLIEWFVREVTGRNYDVTADGAFAGAEVKDVVGTLPERPGICVRYQGHVGVYIGGGYVVEARGFDYGVCITELSERPWTHWYEHPKIAYTGRVLPAPGTVSVKKGADRYDVVWLQIALNRQIGKGKLAGRPLTVDGIYGSGTAKAAAAFWRKKGWTRKREIWGVGKHTIKALS